MNITFLKDVWRDEESFENLCLFLKFLSFEVWGQINFKFLDKEQSIFQQRHQIFIIIKDIQDKYEKMFEIEDYK